MKAIRRATVCTVLFGLLCAVPGCGASGQGEGQPSSGQNGSAQEGGVWEDGVRRGALSEFYSPASPPAEENQCWSSGTCTSNPFNCCSGAVQWGYPGCAAARCCVRPGSVASNLSLCCTWSGYRYGSGYLCD